MNTERSSHPPSNAPGIASAENGMVILDGPCGIAATMTPEVAVQTGENLISAAASAKAQRGVADESDLS